MSIDFDSILVTQNPDLKEVDTIIVPDGGLSRVGSGNWSPPEDSSGGDNTDGGGSGGGTSEGGSGGGGGVICPDNPECGAHDCATYEQLYNSSTARINYLGEAQLSDMYTTVVGSDTRNYMKNFFGGASVVTGSASAFNGNPSKTYPGSGLRFCKYPAWVGNAESASPNTTFSFEAVDQLTTLHGFNSPFDSEDDFTGFTGDFPAIGSPAEFDGTYPAIGKRAIKGRIGIYLDFNNPTGDPANRSVSLRLRGAAPSYYPENSIARNKLQSWIFSLNPLTGGFSLRPEFAPSDYTGIVAGVSGNTGLATTAENERRMTGWYHFVWNGSYEVTSIYSVGRTAINMTVMTPMGNLSTGGSTLQTEGQAGASNRLLSVHRSDGVPSIVAVTGLPFGDANVYVLARHIGLPDAETRAFARLHENYQAPGYCTEIPQV